MSPYSNFVRDRLGVLAPRRPDAPRAPRSGGLTWRSLVACVLATMLLLPLAVFAGPIPDASAALSFPSTTVPGPFIVYSFDPSNLAKGTYLAEPDPVTGDTIDFQAVASYPGVYNAAAFNQLDYYLYAMSQGKILRIGDGGVIDSTDVLLDDFGIDIGFANKNGGTIIPGTELYITTLSGQAAYHVIDLSTGSIDSRMWNENTGASDLAYSEMSGAPRLYGVSPGGDLRQFDPVTNTVTVVAAGFLSAGSGGYGSAWELGNGNFAVQNNGTGDIYQVTFNGVSWSAIFMGRGFPNGNNDGASVVGADVDLAVDKSGGVHTPGQNYTYSVTVSNQGTTTTSGGFFEDVLAAGTTFVSASPDVCEVADAGPPERVRCFFGALGPGASSTVEIVTTTPADNSLLVNTVTVFPNENDINTANNTDTHEIGGTPPLFDKTQGALVDNGDGTYDMTYRLTVTNPKPFDMLYDLEDQLTVVSPLTAAIVSPVVFDPGVSTGSLNTPINLGFDAGIATPGSNTDVVSGEPLAPSQTESFTYTVRYTVPPGDELAGFDDCATTTGPVIVSNTASINAFVPDSECVDVAQLDVAKSSSAPVASAGVAGGWDVTYTLSVTNSGTGAGSYDLSDEILVGSGVSIDSVGPISYSGADGQQGATGAFFNGTTQSQVVGGESLGAKQSESFSYTVTFVVDPSTYNPDAACGGTGSGAAVVNGASLSTGGTDEECVGLPVVEVDKAQGSLVDNGDGTYDMTYTLSVSNSGAAAGSYDLADQLSVSSPITAAVLTGVSFDAVASSGSVTTPVNGVSAR